jgi:L-arabinose isomerase
MTTMTKEVWFVTGSQHLYGPKVLETVAKDSEAIVAGLNSEANLPVNLVCKPTVKSPEEIHAVCQAANTDPNCVGFSFMDAHFLTCENVDCWPKRIT